MSFNLFGKKEEPADNIFTDRAYVSTIAKMNACLELAKKEPEYLFIAWFSDTARKFKEFFTQNGIDESRVTEALYVNTPMLKHKIPVFVEHHPLHARELELIKSWDTKKVIVFSALDEPLFKHFGSDKVIPLIKMLGMKENEAIEHSMVSKSIVKGQEKIAGLVSIEQTAHSQEEWMERNVKK